METLILVLSILAVVLSIVALGAGAAVGYFCTKLWVEMDSFKKSTHQIQYIDPLTAMQNQGNKEQKPDDDPFDLIQ